MNRKVISDKNLPVRMPLLLTVVVWIALDHWNAPRLLYGSAAVLLAVFWVTWAYDLATADRIELFKDGK